VASVVVAELSADVPESVVVAWSPACAGRVKGLGLAGGLTTTFDLLPVRRTPR